METGSQQVFPYSVTQVVLLLALRSQEKAEPTPLLGAAGILSKARATVGKTMRSRNSALRVIVTAESPHVWTGVKAGSGDLLI